MAMVDIEHIKHVKIIVAARILLIDDSIDLLKKERDRNRY
jgi:translation initiation factor 2 gamma subunit (eIF-2gamma)